MFAPSSMAVPGISHIVLWHHIGVDIFKRRLNQNSALKMQEQSIEKCYAYIIKNNLPEKCWGKYNVYEFLLCEEEMKVKKKILTALLTAAMAVSMLAGCGGNQSGKGDKQASGSGGEGGGGTFIVPVNADTTNCLTPYDAYGADDRLMTYGPCYDPLFIVNKDETRWYLAESLEAVADDGCHYQMKLRDGMTWHDGEPITVDDVIFSIKVLQDGSNATDASNVRYDGNDLTAEKIDDLTVNLTLAQPYSAFETEFGRLQIFPEHVFDGNTHIIDNTEALTKGIGSGPFKLKEINAGESIVYEKYDDYYREPASLDEVVIKVMPDESAQEAALQSGELSMMRITSQTKLEKYQSDDEYTVYNIPEGRLNYMAYNYQSPNMKDINARKAIALALNNEEIVQGAYGSEDLAIPATNFCSPENLYYNDEMKGYQQNIEEAKKLAEETGLTEKTLHYIYNQNRPNMKETAQIVQQQLQEIGVSVEIEGVDSSAFFQHLFASWITGTPVEDTSWDLATNGMDQLNADPASKLTSWTGDNLEIGFYVSPETKELWKKASQALTTEDRDKYYKELQVQMNEDYSMYPMANTNYVIAARKEFTGLNEIMRVPIFEDYTKIHMTN